MSLPGELLPEILARLREAADESRCHPADCDCFWCDVRRADEGFLP